MAPKKENTHNNSMKATKKKSKVHDTTKTKTKKNKKNKTTIIKEKMYGDRSIRHHGIMLMTEEELHDSYPFVEDLVFNETMLKKEFNEKNVPDKSCIMGTKADGKTQHRFVIGNLDGEILPKLLNAKWIMIESNIAYGRPITITTTDEEKDKLSHVYAMVREAQLRGIKPL